MRSCLLPFRNLHYNRWVRFLVPRLFLVATVLLLSVSLTEAQQQPAAPSPSGARILLMPRKLVTGERSTLAVLDLNGRLTPDVKVAFSDGESVTTDATGRALFVAPLNPGTFYGSIAGHTGRVSASVLAPDNFPVTSQAVTAGPRAATLTDRFELAGHGFCGDADANRVTVAGLPGLVLAASPSWLVVLPPADLEPGPAQVQASCGQKRADPLTIVFVTLDLESNGSALAPGERRVLTVRVHGSSAMLNLEAHNLSPDVTDLVGGAVARAQTSGGTDNTAKFELLGKQRGTFLISVRLLAPLSRPRP